MSTLQVHPPYALRGRDSTDQQGMQKIPTKQLSGHRGVKAVSPLANEKHTWHREAVRFADSTLATQDQNESK